MKKIKLLPPVLALLCAGMFVGYQAWDRINTDNKAPEITVGEEIIQLSVSEPHSALLQGVTAQDNRDGDVSDTMVVESINALDSDGTMEVTFAAFDQAGNVSKASRTIRYTDYEPPRFYLNRAIVYPYNSSFDLLNAIEAVDPLDGDLHYRIHAMSLDDTSVSDPGDHLVEFRVTNSLGDTTRLTLPVTVYSNGSAALNISLTNYLIYLEKGSSFDADSYLMEVSYSNQVYTPEDLPEAFSILISDDVNTNVPGVYSVDYTVTYARTVMNGTEYITTPTRLIVVVEE